MLRRACLALLAVSSLAPAAHADEVAVLVGPGVRFDATRGGANAIGVVHLDWEAVPMLRVAAEAQTYLGGEGLEGGIGFADAQLGLLFDAPIPGWFGVEVGLHIGLSSLLATRHGADRLIGMLKPELALTATASVFKARLSYQHHLLPIGDTEGLDLRDGQFTLMAGFEF